MAGWRTDGAVTTFVAALTALVPLVVACGADATSAGDTEPASSGTAADGSSAATTHDASTGAAVSTSPDASSGASSPSSTGQGDGTDATAGSTGGEACVDDHRLVAYLANWADCPSADQLAQYSHVVVAFAVSYTWTPDGEICDPSCTIQPLPGCNGTDLDVLVDQLHAADIEVLVSFGGASMGGLWEGTCGEMTKCWDDCVDQVDAVAAQLTALVAANDLDGVDIDYEYCLSDASYIDFVTGLTTELRASLDAEFPDDHKLLTHVPMDSEIEVGDPYYQILAEVGDDIDFVMPQYYNGGRSPFTPDGLSSIHDHYAALVDGLFAGDASRVVFGYCIEPGCQPVATQPEATDVTAMFDGWYPDNGGVFFWAHPDDGGAWFSQPLRSYYDANVCAPG